MINFRKIASVLASTVMVGSTVAMAAAANFPDPFVASGVDSVGIVYGANAQVDLAAVLDIQSKLATELAGQTATGASTASSSTVSGGDFIKLERGSDKFNIRNAMSDFYSTLDEDELSVVLAKGTYSNDDNNDYKFEQQITLGTNLNLTFFEDTKVNKKDPKVGFDFTRNTPILNYSLEFTPDAADNSATLTATTGHKLETTDLPMLGRTYYIQDVTTTSNGVKLTLLDTANSAIVSEGETKSVTVNGVTYDVSIVFISSTEIKLNVNGVTTNSLAEGGIYKVATDTYIAIKDIMARDKTGTVDSVEFSIGSGKMVLEEGQEVEVNNEDISDIENADGSDKYGSTVKTYFTNTSTKISKIILAWTTDEDEWILPGRDLVLPGFETIKLSMGEFNTPKKEKTSFSDNDAVVVDTTISEGDLSLAIISANASFTGFDGIGEEGNISTSSPVALITNGTTNPSFNLSESYDSYFVATWISGDDAESYAYRISSVSASSGKNQTKLTNLAKGGSDITFSEVTDTKDRGRITFTLASASDALGTATVRATASSGTVYGDRLVTKEGLMMKLPVDLPNNVTGDTGFNLSYNSLGVSTFDVNFTEEDKDGNIGQGKSFVITVGTDSGNSGTEPNAVSASYITLKDTADNDIDVGYVSSDLATKLTYTAPSNGLNDLDIEYHGDESFGEVFISESGAALIASSGSSTGVKTLGSVSVKDSEVTSVSAKNLIVVGGSCVNTVAAKLLGSDSALCGDAFTTKTGVASGQYLIETFASPYTTGKVATLVAGYNAGDTTNAAKFLTTQTVDTTAGKKYVGTTSTTATLSTAATTATA